MSKIVNLVIMNPVLENRNQHLRDSQIKFYARGHKYEIMCDPKSKYTSVTTWNHTHFPKFDADAIIKNIFKSKAWGPDHKYWGQSAEQIKASWNAGGLIAASAGTSLHQRIETFMNDERCIEHFTTHKELYEGYCSDIKDLKEWEYFLQFVKDHPELKPYRTEWLVYNEDVKISGSIDMVYENPDGTLSIYDWKRAKLITRINNFNKFAISQEVCHLPDSNFWHYALQLNTYKAIIEAKYDRKIKDIFLVRLHPEAEEKNYELISLPNLSREINELFLERKSLMNI